MLPELLSLVEYKACLELVVHQSPDLFRRGSDHAYVTRDGGTPAGGGVPGSEQ